MKTKAEIRAYAEEVIADIKAARELNESEGIMTDYMRERSFDSQDMWESIAALAKE